jgi:hypothetical protein
MSKPRRYSSYNLGKPLSGEIRQNKALFFSFYVQRQFPS